MLELMAKSWWVFSLRGLLATFFGLTAIFFWPFLHVGLFLWFFGLFALLEGALSIIAVLIKHDDKYWWVIFLEGITCVFLGVAIFSIPGLTADALLTFIAIWAFITGIFEIITAARLHKQMEGDWVLWLIGLTSILFGLSLVAHRFGIGPPVYWLFGLFTIIFGILSVIISFRVRKMRR
ncbi:HdeD family acid-resistance protein [Thermodesulfobacteriota bacterium]